MEEREREPIPFSAFYSHIHFETASKLGALQTIRKTSQDIFLSVTALSILTFSFEAFVWCNKCFPNSKSCTVLRYLHSLLVHSITSLGIQERLPCLCHAHFIPEYAINNIIFKQTITFKNYFVIDMHWSVVLYAWTATYENFRTLWVRQWLQVAKCYGAALQYSYKTV